MKRLYLSLTITVLLLSFAAAQENSADEEAVKKIFPAMQTVKVESGISEGQEFKVYRVFAEGKIIGWAVKLDEMGKIKPVTFLVGIDAQSKVTGVHVLEYRDIFGTEIKRRSFLRQFQGKSLRDKISVGQDIDAVTSATISSEAAASAVRKALNIVEELKK